jgi:hypothetical protein
MPFLSGTKSPSSDLWFFSAPPPTFPFTITHCPFLS